MQRSPTIGRSDPARDVPARRRIKRCANFRQPVAALAACCRHELFQRLCTGLTTAGVDKTISYHCAVPGPKTTPFRVLFVCMGNICRSPTAHGVFLRKVAARGWTGHVDVDSAGTHNYHEGSQPDARAQAHAVRRGYALDGLRARQIRPEDFSRHHLILAMDWDNLEQLGADCPECHRHKLRRLTEFCRQHTSDIVPDPYYGGTQGFERVLDLVEDACDGLLAYIGRTLNLARAR